jgi:hypothetical protein
MNQTHYQLTCQSSSDDFFSFTGSIEFQYCSFSSTSNSFEILFRWSIHELIFNIDWNFVFGRLDCGTGPGIVRSVSRANLGRWNRLTVFRHDWGVWIQLNGGPHEEGRSQVNTKLCCLCALIIMKLIRLLNWITKPNFMSETIRKVLSIKQTIFTCVWKTF